MSNTHSTTALNAPTRIGTGTTYGKVILIGEHSVVYGHPALALPLRQLSMVATVTPTHHEHARFEALDYAGSLDEAPESLRSIVTAVQVSMTAIAKAHGHEPPLLQDIAGFALTTMSAVPPGRGLGSSAAAAGAVIRALYDAYDLPLSRTQAFDLTQQAERVAHGTPSGLDAIATSAPLPVLFQAGEARTLEMGLGGYLVIGDTGVRGSTLQAVSGIRSLRDAEPIRIDRALERLALLTGQVAADLTGGSLATIGSAFTEAHGVLSGLGVSSVELDTLVAAAESAGALGAKLTGGGRGGCMIALVGSAQEAEKIEAAVLSAGAHRTWKVDLSMLGAEK